MTAKEHAVALRRQGKTYSEILKEVPVAKSTLSLWLREVFLAKKQKQRITEKRIASSLRGALARKIDRIKRSKIIFDASQKEVRELSKREMLFIGVALYWAEGGKQKDYNPSVGVDFTNSDYRMLQVFLYWLEHCCGVKPDLLSYEIYLHESCRHKVQQVIQFWASKLCIPERSLEKVRYKTNKINTKRHNTGNLYNGCLRVRVRASSDLNRKISGWINGIIDNLK